MDPSDYIAEQEEEIRALRSRVKELEDIDVQSKVRIAELEEALRVALERKVEETDEGVPLEEPGHQNQAKKEEVVGSRLGVVAAKHEEPTHNATLPVPMRGKSRKPSPAHSQDDDDVIIVDFVQRSPGKRKGGSDQSSSRPTKRQMCWVEIPPRPKRAPPASVKLEPLSPDDATQVIVPTPVVKGEPDEEISNALAVIRNTSSGKTKGALDDVSVFTRLSKIGLDVFPITIEDEIKQLSVTRALLSKEFGGSAMATFPTIDKEKSLQHGFDKFMCISMTSHPHAPSLPGVPGLWMCCKCNNVRWSDKSMRLIVRIETKPKALWQYMGQYEILLSDPLSLAEWTMQSEQTKKEWAEHIHKGKWGNGVRARTKFRKRRGREPTEEDELSITGLEEVTVADIRKAFDNGEELCTWTMKCRGYDEGFQRAIWNAAQA